jgi:hypothetical protein
MEEDMAILDTVKLALRWKGTTLDSEVTRYINWAEAEMERAGVPHFMAVSDTNPLIEDCIVQGCLMNLSTDERIREAAEKSFLYQLDNLRKHDWGPEPEPNPEPDADPEDDTEEVVGDGT